LPYVAFLIPVLSAVRLAKFNIATNQSDQFIGLPTPANAVFFCGIFYIVSENMNLLIGHNEVLMPVVYMLLGIILLFSILLNANIPLIALKFKSFGWKNNEARFSLVRNNIVGDYSLHVDK